jgi:hypothetical protein
MITAQFATTHVGSKKDSMNRLYRELRVAARENNLPEVSRLLSVGADVNAIDNHGQTSLIVAIIMGDVQVVKDLHDHGADIELQKSYGRMPLHFACYNGHVSVVNELLSRGANIEAKDIDGWPALHDGTSLKGHHLSVGNALLSGGANILAANNLGDLPIHQSVDQGKSAVAKSLLRHF